ncbi:MAG: 1,2-phenylacetyl-CoA epoxidase subunit PaaD, partial [Pseudomonadota bacterium]
LGMVRKVCWQGDQLVITITPTYSGCPAMSVIGLSIEAAMEAKGVQNVKIETRLSPPWTTDWISEKGKRALKDYGIAPPQICGRASASDNVFCPRCNSNDVECVSQFGSTPCKAAYRCLSCLEPFDHFKPF